MGDENVIVKFVNLFLVATLIAILMVATFSGNWTKTSAGGIVVKGDGLYWKCTFDKCDYHSYPQGWHETCRYLVFLIWMDLAGTLTANCLSLFVRTFRLSKIFALLYFGAAVLGTIVLIVFPLAVSPIGKDPKNSVLEVWFGYGYYCFLGAVLLMFTIAVQCFEMEPDTYPGF